MSIVLKMKIGTIPYGPMRVKFKRKTPKVGDIVLVRERNAEKYAPWMSVRINGYNDDGYCFAERF